jgi:hypothetical protein
VHGNCISCHPYIRIAFTKRSDIYLIQKNYFRICAIPQLYHVSQRIVASRPSLAICHRILPNPLTWKIIRHLFSVFLMTGHQISCFMKTVSEEVRMAGATAFTHMDEARRRRVLASVAAQAAAAGQLEARLDLAWLLFGDPDIAAKVEHFVDPGLIDEFEREIENVKAALLPIWHRLMRPAASPFPSEAINGIREQLAMDGKASQERETNRRIELHAEYLRQRLLYLGLNRLLLERYSAAPMAQTASLAKKDWAEHASRAAEQIQAIQSKIAQAAHERRRPQSWASLLAQKPHKSRGKPRATPPLKISPVADIPEGPAFPSDAKGNAAVQLDTVAPTAINGPMIEQGPLEPMVAASEVPAPSFPEIEIHPLAPSGPLPERDELAAPGNSETDKIIIEARLGKATALKHCEENNIRYLDSYISPVNLLNYYDKYFKSARLDEFLAQAKLGSMGCRIEGFTVAGLNNDLMNLDEFVNLIEARTRKSHKFCADNFQKIIRNPLPQYFEEKFPKLLSSGIKLFDFYRSRSHGSAFDDTLGIANWWEHIYMYNAYIYCGADLTKIFLKGVALVDIYKRSPHISIQKIKRIPDAKFRKELSFYHGVKNEKWPDTFKMDHIEHIASELIDEFRPYERVMTITTHLPDPVAAYEAVRSKWETDIASMEKVYAWRL